VLRHGDRADAVLFDEDRRDAMNLLKLIHRP